MHFEWLIYKYFVVFFLLILLRPEEKLYLFVFSLHWLNLESDFLFFLHVAVVVPLLEFVHELIGTDSVVGTWSYSMLTSDRCQLRSDDFDVMIVSEWKTLTFGYGFSPSSQSCVHHFLGQTAFHTSQMDETRKCLCVFVSTDNKTML